MVVLGIILIGLGTAFLVSPGLAWSLTKLENAWQGQKSERTDLQEDRRVVGGLALVIIGIVLAVAAWNLLGARSRRDRRPIRHQADRGVDVQTNHRFRQPFVVPRRSSEPRIPGDGVLDHPPPRRQHEGDLGGG